MIVVDSQRHQHRSQNFLLLKWNKYAKYMMMQCHVHLFKQTNNSLCMYNTYILYFSHFFPLRSFKLLVFCLPLHNVSDVSIDSGTWCKCFFVKPCSKSSFTYYYYYNVFSFFYFQFNNANFHFKTSEWGMKNDEYFTWHLHDVG